MTADGGFFEDGAGAPGSWRAHARHRGAAADTTTSAADHHGLDSSSPAQLPQISGVAGAEQVTGPGERSDDGVNRVRGARDGEQLASLPSIFLGDGPHVDVAHRTSEAACRLPSRHV